MNYVDLALRWMHILAAIALVGGTFFLRFVWLPATRKMDYRDRETDFAALRSGWAKVVMLSTLFLLVSGLVNAVNNIKRNEFADGSGYEIFVVAKLVIALALFFLSARVAGRSESAARFRERIGKWLTINTALALLLVGMAGYMKMVPRTPKPEPTSQREENALTPAVAMAGPRSYEPVGSN